MPRPPRIDIGNVIYHVINRANARTSVFNHDTDYRLFENILIEAKGDVVDMRILSYCLMPNHWHLIVCPRNDGDMAKYMRWVTLTHTRRWHIEKETVGAGHLYQGRYKSFPIENGSYFLTACRYVERNALRAGLVKRAEDWRWSSVWRREHVPRDIDTFLSEWPENIPSDYLDWLNMPQTDAELAVIRASVNRGKPLGAEDWVKRWAQHKTT